MIWVMDKVRSGRRSRSGSDLGFLKIPFTSISLSGFWGGKSSCSGVSTQQWPHQGAFRKRLWDESREEV